MNINSLFPSKYLKAADLGDEPLDLRISEVRTEQMNDGSMKPIISFTNSPKKMVLNRVNADALTELYGPDTDNWTGKTARLFSSTTSFQGKTVDCIRILPPAAQKKAAEDFGYLDDSIKF